MIRQNARQVDTYAVWLAFGERHHNIECVAAAMSSRIDVLCYVETREGVWHQRRHRHRHVC